MRARLEIAVDQVLQLGLTQDQHADTDYTSDNEDVSTQFLMISFNTKF